ncbi:MAG: hypothetical protein LBQ69_02820, partial [Treponema sp.]|jgi:hypothetical protein|nr:hypothetical protein [Treponema sp.]
VGGEKRVVGVRQTGGGRTGRVFLGVPFFFFGGGGGGVFMADLARIDKVIPEIPTLTMMEKMNWDKAKTIILKNKEVQNELKMNEAEYRIIEEIIMARKEKKLTQSCILN